MVENVEQGISQNISALRVTTSRNFVFYLFAIGYLVIKQFYQRKTYMVHFNFIFSALCVRFDVERWTRAILFTVAGWNRASLLVEKWKLVRSKWNAGFKTQLTNLSSADGPASGTLMSSRWRSCGFFRRLCGPPCGNPMGPAKAPNGPSGPKADGIDCGGAPGICCAWICC